MTGPKLTDQAFDQLFLKARTANGWLDKDVDDSILKEIHDVMKFGPTSANCCPLRIVFVKTPEAKERLKPMLDPGNVGKSMSAPVVAIFAQDMKFYEHMPYLFPHADAKSWFVGNDKLIESTAFRNSSLQAAYFMIAARGFGLDCGPMSGFNQEKLNAEFFPDGRFKSNFICGIGYRDDAKTHPRSPRFKFEDVCTIL